MLKQLLIIEINSFRILNYDIQNQSFLIFDQCILATKTNQTRCPTIFVLSLFICLGYHM